jgi:hypothetical protein
LSHGGPRLPEKRIVVALIEQFYAPKRIEQRASTCVILHHFRTCQ